MNWIQLRVTLYAILQKKFFSLSVEYTDLTCLKYVEVGKLANIPACWCSSVSTYKYIRHLSHRLFSWWTWTTLAFFCSIFLFLCQTNITGIWLKKLMRCWWWSGQAAQSAFETSAIIISLLYINHQQWTAAPLFFATLMFPDSSWSQFDIQLYSIRHTWEHEF